MEWDILVVDNGAEDGSSALGETLSSSAALRVVAEPHAGLSHARNRAIAATSAEHLIFIDDDVTVSPDWLAAYVEGFQRYPRAAFWGGPIAARLEETPSPRPRARRTFKALKHVMPGVLGHLEPDLPEGPLEPEKQLLPWGANMAFRRSALDGRSFDSTRGRRPDDQFGADEETQLFRELMQAGHHGAWLPAASLEHHVSQDRCRPGYLKAYSWSIGVSEGRLAFAEQEAEAVRNWAAKALRERRRARWLTAPWARLERRLEALRDLGFIEGFLHGFDEALAEKRRSDRL